MDSTRLNDQTQVSRSHADIPPPRSQIEKAFSMSVFTSATKIKKAKKADPTPFEESVAQALYDLQVNSDKLKGEYSPQLRALSFFRK